MPLAPRLAVLSFAVLSLFPTADGEPAAAAPLVHVPPGALVLRDGWRIESSRVVPRPDREITAVGFDDSWWHPATVPTTVLRSLVAEGIYPDPKIGLNNQRIPDINDAFNEQFHQGKFSHLPPTANPMNPWNKPWWFRKEFDAPADYRGKRVWLNFGGINYRADVWLNGRRVADARTMAAMFQRFRFDVTDAIRPGQRNCLAVLVHPWDVEARGQEPPELFNGTGRTDREAFRNVSAQSLGGWDYVNDAADRGTGIWQDVFLETSGPVLLEHPDVVTTGLSPDGGAAKLTVRVFARNASAEKKAVTLRVKLAPQTFGGGTTVEFTAPAELAPGETREIFLKPEDHSELTLTSPHLWWPRNYGSPDLYHAEIAAEVDGAPSYRAETDFGIRTVDTRILPTGGREFFVNGRKIRISGGAWVMDPLLEKDARRYEEEVRLCVEGNHTLLRMHGASVVPPDALVDACDRQGLLLWTEFFSHGAPRHVAETDHSRYDWSADTGLYLDCARDNILRLRSHPSLLIWVGLNEDWLPRELYDPIYEMVASLDGAHHFLPGSHQHGNEPDWVKEHSEAYSGGPWIYRSPIYGFQGAADLKAKSWGFRSEVGFPTPPSINSVIKFIPDWDQPDPANFPLNADMGYHQAHMQFTNGHVAELQKFGPPADLADYLMGWEFLNEETHRGYYETLNKNITRTGGGLLWKAIPSSPCFLWSVFDWYLRPHAGYYAMMRANQSLHVQYNMDDQTISVCNVRGTEQKDLRVAVELRDADWQLVLAETHAVSVAPDRSEVAARLAPGDSAMRYLRLVLYDADGQALDHNFYLLPGTRGLEPVQFLPPVKVTITADRLQQKNGETAAVISLHNSGNRPALMTTPSILNGAEGDEILPTFWNDRCVEIMPGESRQFIARWATDRQGAVDPHLIVEGWNILPAEINLRDGKPVDLQLQIQRAGKVDDLKAGQVERIPMTVAETAPAGGGSRVTTWPVSVRVGDGPARTIRVGAINGRSRQVGVPVVFTRAGTQSVTVGDKPAFELFAGEPWPVRSLGATAYIDGGGAGMDSLGFKLTDGDPKTSWSATVPKKWVFLDLGTEKSVRAVTLEWGATFVSHYQIQVSGDSINWQTVSEKSDGKGGSDTTDFPPAATRYVRFNGLEGPADAKGFELREMTVR